MAGYREGRSPDILTITDEDTEDRVPVVFYGAGFEDLLLPDGFTLDQVAPTLAAAAGIERPHPEVRSGTPIGSFGRGTEARLILVVALTGTGANGIDAAALEAMRSNAGAATAEARIGSAPVDRTAALTTLGTGGLPRQHGITAGLIRNDSGELVKAWGPRAPVSVIATLADDLDEMHDQKAKIGLVASKPTDRGLIGGNWYVDADDDEVRIARGRTKQLAEAEALLRSGYGNDNVPDLLGVVLDPRRATVDRDINTLLSAARDAADDRLVGAVVGLGNGDGRNVDAVKQIERRIEGRKKLIEGAVPGGFFVDQDALTKTGKTEDEVIDAIKATDGFADAFGAITVTFERYC